MPDKADDIRKQYLELCQSLIEHAQLMRNYAMEPGDAWLAKAELAKVAGILSELESQIEAIRQADQG